MPRTVLTLVGLTIAVLFGLSDCACAQTPRDDLGAWYGWFWTVPLGDGGRLVATGDVQHRAWNLLDDKEQDLVRGGLAWSPEALPVGFGAGVAHFTNGGLGDAPGPDELRLHQDVLLAHPVAEGVQLRHRVRLEERWIDGQDLRTRARYMVTADVPLNGRSRGKGALYLPLTNEIFVNGETDLGGGRTADRFDRNWFFAGIGYGLTQGTRAQFSWLLQSTNTRSRHHLVLAFVSTF